MPTRRFGDGQIAFALRRSEAGTTVDEICGKMGIAAATFYRWKKVHAGMGGAPCCAIGLSDNGERDPKAEAARG